MRKRYLRFRAGALEFRDVVNEKRFGLLNMQSAG